MALQYQPLRIDWDAILKAMGLPIKQKAARLLQHGKFLWRDGMVVFTSGICRSSDDALHEVNLWKLFARAGNQTVLADAGRPDDGNEVS